MARFVLLLASIGLANYLGFIQRLGHGAEALIGFRMFPQLQFHMLSAILFASFTTGWISLFRGYASFLLEETKHSAPTLPWNLFLATVWAVSFLLGYTGTSAFRGLFGSLSWWAVLLLPGVIIPAYQMFKVISSIQFKGGFADLQNLKMTREQVTVALMVSVLLITVSFALGRYRVDAMLRMTPITIIRDVEEKQVNLIGPAIGGMLYYDWDCECFVLDQSITEVRLPVLYFGNDFEP